MAKTITTEEAAAGGYVPAMRIRFVERITPTGYPNISHTRRVLQQLHIKFNPSSPRADEAWVDVPVESED